MVSRSSSSSSSRPMECLSHPFFLFYNPENPWSGCLRAPPLPPPAAEDTKAWSGEAGGTRPFMVSTFTLSVKFC